MSPEQVSRDVLLAAMKGTILAKAELNVIYSRPKEKDEDRTFSTPR